MSDRNTETRAFGTDKGAHKGFKSERSREKLVIAIFVVIIAILTVFAGFIVNGIINKLGTGTTTAPNQSGYTYKITDPSDCKTGTLLLINSTYKGSFPSSFENMINVYDYQRSTDNYSLTHVGDKMAYSLSFKDIYLDSDTLDAFNAMIADYCKTIDTSSADQTSASDLEIAWGGYHAGNTSVYDEDLSSSGKDFYDHCLGTSLTLKYNSDHTRINEAKLKKDFAWIYENAHKYGFIIRYPEECSDHTGFDSNTRVHLRYVGVAHATYIYENGICLDEYLELLRTTYNSYDKPLTVTASGKTYEIYYASVIASPTSISVPKDHAYTVSGDNMNGLIITVEK